MVLTIHFSALKRFATSSYVLPALSNLVIANESERFSAKLYNSWTVILRCCCLFSGAKDALQEYNTITNTNINAVIPANDNTMKFLTSKALKIFVLRPFPCILRRFLYLDGQVIHIVIESISIAKFDLLSHR